MKKKNKKSLLKKLKSKCDKLTSLYVRLSGAKKNGITTCYTCGVKIHYKESNAGHFKHNKLDYDLRNRRVQCIRCNKWLSGNLGVFALKLVKENGVEWVDKLVLDANTKSNNYSILELEEIKKDLEERLDKLKGDICEK